MSDDTLFIAIQNGKAYRISVPSNVDIKGYKMTEEEINETLMVMSNEHRGLNPNYEYRQHINDYVRDEANKLIKRAGIYCIKCNSNGKVYVGASRQIRQRIKGHIVRLSNLADVIGRDVKQYGIQNFSFILLEKIDDESMLSDREKFWIEKLNSINNGYNKPAPIVAHPAWSEA